MTVSYNTLFWYCTECRLACQNVKGGWAAQVMNSERTCIRCTKAGVSLFGYRELLKESTGGVQGIYGVPRSRRPCNLNETCTGSMAATVRKFGANYSTLTWYCDTCKNSHTVTSKHPIRSAAAVALDDEQDEADRLAAALVADTSGSMSELREMSAHIRGVMHEDKSGE